jgi:uncharacterized protein with von Willebrand factor type A (vWA) domain
VRADASPRAAAVALGRALRGAGLPVAIDRELLFLEALAEVDLRRPDHVYWAARAAFLTAPHQIAAFEEVFARFWAGLSLDPEPSSPVEHGESDPRMPGPQRGGESLPQFRPSARSGSLLDGEPTRAAREILAPTGEEGERGPRRGVIAAYSAEEVETRPEPLAFESEEVVAVRRLAEELRRRVPLRRSRRPRSSKRPGRLDVRRTLRAAMRTDGEAIRPAFVSPSERPRKLLFVCDVSGSMERYSRVLLASLGAAVRSGARAEAFVFATRLTRLTPELREGEVGAALERARAAVADWSGGTRIGLALAELNRIWGPRGLARGAIAFIVSDGWDRGDPELLAREVERLRLQCRRLVWLNPRPGDLAGQPLAIGLRAALPCVDDYIPGHDARAVAGLARLVGGLDSGRPTRGSGHFARIESPREARPNAAAPAGFVGR